MLNFLKVPERIVILIAALVLSACAPFDRQTSPLEQYERHVAPKKNITIALLGATGMVGGYILQEALEQGYDVRALARTPQKLQALKDQITIVKGDARDLSVINSLLRGSDIVISALGPTKADGEAAKTVSATATGHIIQLMPEHNISRYVLVSGAAVDIPGDKRNFTGWLIKKLAVLALNDAVKDKQAEYQLLADSSIEWTLIRSPLIEDKPFKLAPKASLDTPSSFSLRAGELAHFIIEQIDSREYVRKGPFLESQ